MLKRKVLYRCLISIKYPETSDIDDKKDKNLQSAEWKTWRSEARGIAPLTAASWEVTGATWRVTVVTCQVTRVTWPQSPIVTCTGSRPSSSSGGRWSPCGAPPSAASTARWSCSGRRRESQFVEFICLAPTGALVVLINNLCLFVHPSVTKCCL